MDVQVETFFCPTMGANVYLAHTEGHGIIIDAGVDDPVSFAKERGIEIGAVLLTHAHFDHVKMLDEIISAVGCPAYIGEAEVDWAKDREKNLAAMMGAKIAPQAKLLPLKDGQRLEFPTVTVQAHHTPGHSPGGMTYEIENCLFTGDVLFRLTVGRSDFYGSDPEEMRRSLNVLVHDFPEEDIVYPGHGDASTIGFEKQNNVFLKGMVSE